jgi:predicted molibdopterin-dependent oxidoreductase YjgC
MQSLHDFTEFARLPGSRGAALSFTFDGQNVPAYEGETVAAALWATGRSSLRTTARRDEPRGAFCLIGVCFDCLVRVDGRANVRACQQPVRDGMQVESQRGDNGGAGGGP